MTEDDIRKKLDELGVNPGNWQKTKGTPGNEPAFIRNQKEHFTKLLPFLEKQLEDDIALLAQLKETKKRLKYGGGM